MKRINSSSLVTITLDRANELIEKARTSGHPNDVIELTIADLRRIIDLVADEAFADGITEGFSQGNEYAERQYDEDNDPGEGSSSNPPGGFPSFR